jgi:hypothetical protein
MAACRCRQLASSWQITRGHVACLDGAPTELPVPECAVVLEIPSMSRAIDTEPRGPVAAGRHDQCERAEAEQAVDPTRSWSS